MDGLIETWRGEALAWEADELNHINMRFYFQRANEARASFAQIMGLPAIYKTSSLSTLLATYQHINYLAEIRPGQKMTVRSGIVSLGETDCQLLHIIYGHEDKPAASIVEQVSHISIRTKNSFIWPKRVKHHAEKIKINLPDLAKPRGLDLPERLKQEKTNQEKTNNASIERADKLGLETIGRGAFRPDECDVFGYVRDDAIVGRVSDCGQHLSTAWRDLDFASDDGVSGAMLEGLVSHETRPIAGDLFVMRSGLRAVSTNVRELCHWLLDPVTGKCWSRFSGVSCRFNLKTRRLVKIDDDVLALLTKGIVKGLNP